jgi:hypothetical protein
MEENQANASVLKNLGEKRIVSPIEKQFPLGLKASITHQLTGHIGICLH